MAKSKRGGRGISTPNSTANPTRVARPTVPLVVTLPPISQTPLFDRRVFSPTKTIAPPHALNRNATRIVVDKFGKSVRAQTKATLRFKVPQHVALCVRRKRRKEVIHALGKAGSGTVRRKPKRNYWSAISCR